MDPLSIAASVAGSLGAIGSVSSLLGSLISRFRYAPRELQSLSIEVKEVQAALVVLHRYMQNFEILPSHRAGLISVRQLGGTLTEVVLTISEIEALVGPCTVVDSPHATVFERIRIAFNSTDMTTIIQRLQRNKSSLNLMFSIIQW